MYERPFEIFARAQSQSYFEQLRPMLGIASKIELDALMTEFSQGKRGLPNWEFDTINPAALANWSKLATIP